MIIIGAILIKAQDGTLCPGKYLGCCIITALILLAMVLCCTLCACKWQIRFKNRVAGGRHANVFLIELLWSALTPSCFLLQYLSNLQVRIYGRAN